MTGVQTCALPICETSAEDQQLSIWSNESMKSSAFDGFHLSDLEYGVRLHHDMLRGLLPVMLFDEAPSEAGMQAANTECLIKPQLNQQK